MKNLILVVIVWLVLVGGAHAQSAVGPLQAQNNLADVPNKTTALVNLGVNPLGGDLTGTTGNAVVHTLGGLAIAPSATTDTTNASNITSGLLGCSYGGTGRSTGTAGGLIYWSSTPCSNAQTAWQVSGVLTLNALILGGGTGAPTVLGSLGTTTTVLHGNASGVPSFGAVNLATDVSGLLPLANMASISTGLLGNSSVSAAAPSLITLGGGLSFSSTTLVAQWQGGTVTSLAGGLTLVSGALTAPVSSVSGTTGQITTSATTGAIVISLPTTITQDENFSGGLTTTTLTASGSLTLNGLATGTQASCLGLTSGNVMVALSGACSTPNVTLAPGLTSATGTQNTGTQTLGNGTTLALQSWPKAETANYTLSYPTDLGTTLVANGSAVITFTLRNPAAGTEGTMTPIFQDESGHGFTLTTSGGTATFYGFSGGGATSFQFPAYTAVQCRDDGTNYLCALTGAGGGSGSGTVNSGTAGQIGYYASSGTTISGASDITISSGTLTLETNTKISSSQMSTVGPFGLNNASPTALLDAVGKDNASGTINFRFRNLVGQVLLQGTDAGALSGMGPVTLGLAGTVGGSITMAGLTSGTVQITVPAAAGTGTVFELPSTNGTSGQFLQTNGSGVTTWASASGNGTVNSGLVNQLAYYAATGTAVSSLANITTGNGSLTFGTNGTIGGAIQFEGATSGSVIVGVPVAAGTGTVFTLPSSNGSSGQVLQTNGSGATSWVTAAGGGNMTGPGSSTVGDIVCFNNTVGTLTEDCGAPPAPYTGTNQVLLVNNASVQGGAAWGVAGTVLLGNGATTAPSFGSLPYTSLSGLPTAANQVIAGSGSTTGLYTLTAGTNVTITQAAGTITIASTGGGGGSLAIGASVSGGTAGDMLYVGSGAVLAQSLAIPASLENVTTTQTGTTYTFAATDCNTTVLFTSTSAVTATIPSSIVPAAGSTCNIVVLQGGTAKVSVNGTAVSAATLISAHSYTGTSGIQGSAISLTLATVSSATDAYLTGDGS